jgi:hypothetical protein
MGRCRANGDGVSACGVEWRQVLVANSESQCRFSVALSATGQFVGDAKASILGKEGVRSRDDATALVCFWMCGASVSSSAGAFGGSVSMLASL